MKLKSFKLSDICKAMLFAGIFIRIVYYVINLFVGGNNCDEVMVSVNAASLVNNMTDISGEHMPVYFDTWIVGGQSPFATYVVALFVKLFGLSLFSVRLPSLLISCLSLIAIYYLSIELFSVEKYRIALVALSSVSPWMIYSASYTLDCNYFGHIVVFAMFFFIKAVNREKPIFYFISMVFFATCFYCYIASVLFVPVFLLISYLVLIIKKRISIKNTILSVATIFVFALPFILWGLVVSGIIGEFSFLGFSFNRMPEYSRGSDVIISSGLSLNLFANMITNLLILFGLLLIPDYNSLIGLGSNIFQFGNLLSGVFVILGLVKLLFALKRKSDLNFASKLISLASFLSVLFYGALINNPCNGTLYRYSVLSFLLIIFEAIGMCDVLKKLKSLSFKKVVSTYSILSIIVFSFLFFYSYVPQTKSSPNVEKEQCLFADSFYECLEYAENKNDKRIVVYKEDKLDLMTTVFCRYHYYKDKEFYTTIQEVNQLKNENDTYSVSKDNSISYALSSEKNVISDDYCIVETKNIDKYSIDKSEYIIKEFGFWTVIYKV